LDESAFVEPVDAQVAFVPLPPPVVQLVSCEVEFDGFTPGADWDCAVFEGA
jgi:hypothetical protein